MVDFKSPEAFADADDPKLVADAKRDVASPTEYSYTEASTINTVERWDEYRHVVLVRSAM